MPVRVRITLLFSLFAFIILSVVCGVIYYFSHKSREDAITRRLTNRAITTARLLSQREIFDKELIRRIDSSTTLALKNKTVQAYDQRDNIIYSYSDAEGDVIPVRKNILDEARLDGSKYFKTGNKEAVAYYYTGRGKRSMVVVTAAQDVEGIKNLNSLLKILLLSFLVGMLFVLVGGYIFSGSLLKPVRKISEDVAEISAQNLTRRIKTGTAKDEWYQLSDTLNQLLNRLQESFDLQRRFISNASHELSTPLTAISSQLEVSLQREREAHEYRKVMESIYQDVQHMSKLTQTLLEFAKASGNTGGLEINLVRIDEIIFRLPAEVAKADSGYTVHLQFENLPAEEDSLLVFGNEPLLFTAIRNIVMNACKYSADHAAKVGLKVTGNDLIITIEDRGKGIPEYELTSIFQPFYRAKENDGAPGFGLGLSMANRIIKIHKGTINVQSEEGKGTVFTISLPGAPALKGI